ncbi:hypothetical protein EDB19DRAFT_1834590 [Suillus lakei]|nr:hypothetical protein EDB19DRAFT_1834590 [Suillus lakei]
MTAEYIWGLKSSRGQAHSIESIGPAIERVHVHLPKQGSHNMKQTLLQEENIMVSRELILKYMNIHHPDEVQDQKRCWLKRSTYWTAGLHDSWVFDQHDKWCRFQLFLHIGIKPFSGRILWLKVWWTNHNPPLICGWYCDTVNKLGAMPLIMQSDPGTENDGIANGHTMLRHLQDPALARTLQHKFKGWHRNIKSEIFWSQLRRRWAPGFEDVLEFGFTSGIYNPEDALKRLAFILYSYVPATDERRVMISPPNFEPKDSTREWFDPNVQEQLEATPFIMLVEDPAIMQACSPVCAALQPAPLLILNLIWMMNIHILEYQFPEMCTSYDNCECVKKKA